MPAHIYNADYILFLYNIPEREAELLGTSIYTKALRLQNLIRDMARVKSVHL